MDKEAARFRILLAEDDAVSREFLCEALRACGGEPTACADGPAALAQARARPWNLLILDHQLPGMDGDAVLAALRADPGPGASLPPAIATTANPAGASAALLQAGFAQVLSKPIPLEALRVALAPFGCRADPLDDDDALRACGSPSAVERLRQLFAEQELPRVQDEFERHARDLQALRPMLHRLLASCGFCGATALARACGTLHEALTSGAGPERTGAATRAFRDALKETREGLHSKLSGGT